MKPPILYSFRRCPYAMRARIALKLSEIQYDTIEVSLSNKPTEMLKLSPKGTVPVLILPDMTVIDESLEIMLWALKKNDPKDILDIEKDPALNKTIEIIKRNDGYFKHHLDRYKYPNRYEGAVSIENRSMAMKFIWEIDNLLNNSDYIFGKKITLADIAIAPFIRQFSKTDLDWFLEQPINNVKRWLENITSSYFFEYIMRKK